MPHVEHPPSVAEKHVDLFRTYINRYAEIPTRELEKIIHLLDNALSDWVAENGQERVTFLTDAERARNFAMRCAYQHFDWDDYIAETTADQFADLVADFCSYDRMLEEDHTLRTEDFEPATTSSSINNSEASVEAISEEICAEFMTFLTRGQRTTQFSMSDVVLSLTNSNTHQQYLAEKVTALRMCDGARLLQLVIQDRGDRSQFTPSQESQMQELVRQFHDDEVASAVFWKLVEQLDGLKNPKENRFQRLPTVEVDDEEEDEETEEAYINTCKSLLSSLPFGPVTKSVHRFDIEAMLEDPIDLRGVAHAIRKNDYVAFAHLLSTHMQEDNGFHEFPPSVDSIVQDVKSVLQEYHAFMDPKTAVAVLPPPSLFGDLFGTQTGGSIRLGGFSAYNPDKELQRYRDGHPELTDAVPKVSQNVDFYRGAAPHPYYKCFIDDFHNVAKYRESAAATTEMSTWFGDYYRLEAEHSYIQHLFPIQEGAGLSSCSQRLQKHEILTMREDPVIRERLLRSLETMLDFFGITMNRTDAQPLLIRNEANFEMQFNNLNLYSHNYLRITRICKCLGDLGCEVFQIALIDFFIRECFEWLEEDACLLKNPRESLANYWVGTVRDDATREIFQQRIDHGKERILAESKKA